MKIRVCEERNLFFVSSEGLCLHYWPNNFLFPYFVTQLLLPLPLPPPHQYLWVGVELIFRVRLLFSMVVVRL